MVVGAELLAVPRPGVALAYLEVLRGGPFGKALRRDDLAAEAPLCQYKRHPCGRQRRVPQRRNWCYHWASGLLGDPYLSFPLVRADPPPAGVACCPIYLVKQDTDQPQPTLFWIKSLSDVELFGITGQNYEQFVVGVPQFQEQYDYVVSDLPRADLAPLPPTTPVVTSPPVAGASDEGHLGSFPPYPYVHLGFTLPPGWTMFTGAPSWRLSGQTLVTSLYPTAPGTTRMALEIDRLYSLLHCASPTPVPLPTPPS